MTLDSSAMTAGYEIESLQPPSLPDHPSLLTDETSSAYGLWKGEFWVDANGSARYRVPIELPPGRRGMAPSLALEYSSASGLDHVGSGWRIAGGSEIYRCNHTINHDGHVRAVRLDASDAYCLDGNRLVESAFDPSTRVRVYLTEVERHQRIQAQLHPTDDNVVEAFTVEQPNGLKYRYSIQVRTREGGIPYRFLLSRVTDPHGNFYSFEYLRVDAPAHDLRAAPEELLRFVRYTANDGNHGAPLTTATKVVSFTYDDLPKPFRGYRHGSPIQITKRLREVRVAFRTSATQADVFRRYVLQYEEGAVDGHSRLQRISACDVASVCLPPLAFEYGPMAAEATGFEEVPIALSAPDVDALFLMDLDGNGLDDVVWEDRGTNHQRLRAQMARHRADAPGFVLEGAGPNPADVYSYGANELSGAPPYDLDYVVSDLDQDGRSDLMAYDRGFAAECIRELWWDVVRPDGTTQRFFDHFDASTYATSLGCQVYPQDCNCLPPVTSDPWDDRYCHAPHPQATVLEHRETRCEDSPWRLFSDGSVFDDEGSRTIRIPGRYLGSDDVYPNHQFLPHGSFLADIDGDGYPQPVRCFVHNQLGPVYRAEGVASVGTGDWRCDQLGTPGLYRFFFDRAEGTPLVFDSDGDGASEIFTFEHGLALRTSVPGAAVWHREVVDLPEEVVRSSFMGTTLADVNGDGNIDLIGASLDASVQLEVSVWFNTGRNFVKAANPLFTAPLGFPLPTTLPVLHAADLDGDAAEEIFAYAASDHALTWFAVDHAGAMVPTSLRTFTGASVERLRFGNLDENGVPDLVIHDGTQWRAFVNRGRKASLLTAVRENTSAPSHVIDYGTTVREDLYEGALDGEHCRAHSEAGVATGLRCQVGPMIVVSSHWEDAGVDHGGRTFTYRYEDGTWDRWGRGWLGFRQITRTDVAAGETQVTRYHVDRGRAGLVEKYTRSVAMGPLPDGQPSFYEWVEEWGWRERALGTRAVLEPTFHLQSEFLRHDPLEDTNPVRGARTDYLDHDARGRPERVVVDRFDGTLEQSTTDYHDDESAWLLGQVQRVVVTRTDEVGTVATTETAYQWTSRGDVEAVIVRPNGDPLQLRTDLSYDVFGNLQRQTQTEVATSRTRTESWEYDAREHTYPSARVSGDVLSLRSEMVHHPHFGAPRMVMSPDGTSTLMRYDGFGRVTETRAADGSTTLTGYEAPPAGPAAVVRVTRVVAGELPIHVDLDRLGRPFAELSFDYQSQAQVRALQYDGLGRLVGQSRPTRPGVTPSAFELFEHDLLGRLQRHTQVDGAETRYAYHLGLGTLDGSNAVLAWGESTTKLNARGFATTTHSDPGGRVIRVDDALGGVTQYGYGPSGLREVIDARGNLISMALDAYGARESITDPDTGHTSFMHNAFGEPTLQIDNAGIQTQFFYDHLGRLERKEVYDPADGTTDTSLWSYGWTGPERGRLRSLIGPDGHRVDYGYNPSGQLASETYGLASGESFRFDYGFDAIGRLQHLTYPAAATGVRPEVEYSYRHGMVQQVLDRSSRYTYWTRLATNADDQTTAERFGSEQRGSVRESSYASWGGLDRRIVRSHAGSVLSDLGTYWDSNRNLAGRIDHRQGVLEYFSYDPLDRLGESCFVGSVQPVYAETTAWSPLPQVASTFDAQLETYGAVSDPPLMSNWENGNQEPETLASFNGVGMGVVRAQGTVRDDDFVMLNQAPRSQGFAPCTAQTYDPLGNILFKDGVGSYGYAPPAGAAPSGPRANAVRTLTPLTGAPRSFSYDARGNITDNGREGFTYTAEGFLRTLTSLRSGATTHFEYLAGGQRAKKRSETDEILYAGGLYQRRTTRSSVVVQSHHAGALASSHYFITVDGGAVAELQLFESEPTLDAPPPADLPVSPLYGRHAIVFSFDDHMGSPVLLTNHEGDPIEYRSYDAFGRMRPEQWGPHGTPPGNRHRPIGFTGHEDDSESGLVNMIGRVYDPELGRFLTPDPTIPHPGYSQAYNRYAYVYNNPLTLTDPSGYNPTSVTTNVGGGGGGGGGGSGGGPANGGFGNQDLQPQQKRTAAKTQNGVTRSSNPRSLRNLAEARSRLEAKRRHYERTGQLRDANLDRDVTRALGIAIAAPFAVVFGVNGLFVVGDAVNRFLTLGLAGMSSSTLAWAYGGGLYNAGCLAGGILSPDPSLYLCSRSPADELGRGGRLLSSSFGDDATRAVAVRGIAAGSRVNMPAWRKIAINMKHIAERHMPGGSGLAPGNRKDVFQGMTETQVERAVRNAYRYGEVLQSQDERVFVVGPFGSGSIHMWVNRATKEIESAWPKF